MVCSERRRQRKAKKETDDANLKRMLTRGKNNGQYKWMYYPPRKPPIGFFWTWAVPRSFRLAVVEVNLRHWTRWLDRLEIPAKRIHEAIITPRTILRVKALWLSCESVWCSRDAAASPARTHVIWIYKAVGRLRLEPLDSLFRTTMSTANDEVNPYELLEVTLESSEADIRRAYRQRSLKVHPDRVMSSQYPLNNINYLTNTIESQQSRCRYAPL